MRGTASVGDQAVSFLDWLGYGTLWSAVGVMENLWTECRWSLSGIVVIKDVTSTIRCPVLRWHPWPGKTVFSKAQRTWNFLLGIKRKTRDPAGMTHECEDMKSPEHGPLKTPTSVLQNAQEKKAEPWIVHTNKAAQRICCHGCLLPILARSRKKKKPSIVQL